MIRKGLRTSTLAILIAIAGTSVAARGQESNQLSVTSALKIASSHRKLITSAVQAYQSALASRSALSAYPATTFSLGDATQPDLQQGEDLLVTQPVDLFGKFRSNRRIGSAEVSSAAAKLHLAKLTVQTEVINAYAQACSAQLLVALGQKELAIARQLYDGTMKRVDAGELPPSQGLRAQLGLDTAKTTLALRKSQAESALANLSGALGVQVPAKTFLAMPHLPAPSVRLEKRPDLESALSSIQAAQALHLAAKLSSLPDFEIQMRRSYWSLPEQYGIQFQMTWNLWDHGAAHNKTKSAYLSIQSAQSNYQDLLTKAQTEVQAAMDQYSGANAAVEQYDKLKSTASTLLAQTQRAFELGGATLLDVLDAEQAYQLVQESEVSAQLTAAQAAASYYQAGGDLISNS